MSVKITVNISLNSSVDCLCRIVNLKDHKFFSNYINGCLRYNESA